MSNQDQLSVVIIAFEGWRKTRGNRNSRTPQGLRQQALALKSHYSSGKITTALRISGGQFKQWTNESKCLEETINFVQLPVTHSPQTDGTQAGALNLELSFSQGEQLRLSGQITPTHLATLIKEMRA